MSELDSGRINCELMPMNEYETIESDKKRFGRYHRTNFWNIKGYGKDTWVVAARLRVVDPLPVGHDLSESDILERCIDFLNTPPAKKKYAKKDPVPKYGNLKLYHHKKFCESGIFSVLLKVKKSKNKYFWGRGKNV